MAMKKWGEWMKLSLLTYQMARGWELAKVIDVAKAGGFAGIEFRVAAGHRHGVELDATAAQRRAIRNQLQDAYLAVAALGTGSRFDTPDARQRQDVVEQTKRYIELAAEVGSGRIRVFGNDMPKGEAAPDRVAVLRYVGEALHELGQFAAPFGVDVLLEMHGQFNYWGFARKAVEYAAHARVGLVYNCDRRDLVGGSVAATYGEVASLVRHVHMHHLTDGFPYAELFRLLVRDGYTGYLSSEVEQEVPSPEEYLHLYAMLCQAWGTQAARDSRRSRRGGDQ
jgi:sugar phosphate isomerase/epimerase